MKRKMNQYFIKKMTGFLRCLFAFAFVSVVFSAIGIAQEEPKDEFTKFVQLKGRVVDEKGNGISDVAISIYGTSRGTVSQKDGNFEIPVPEGQPFGLYCWHPKYIIKNYPVDDTNLDKKITLVLKETICEIDFVREIFACSPDEIDKNMPVPKFKLIEEDLVDWFDEGIPLYPGGIENLCKRYKKEVQNQFKYKTNGKPLNGVYHGSFIIDKNGWMDLLKIEERTTKNQTQQIRDFFKRFGQWKPAKWRGVAFDREFRFTINFKLDLSE
jgi:hypothetical protein